MISSQDYVNQGSEFILWVIIGAVLLIIVFAMLVKFLLGLNEFSRELNNIEMEIARTSGRERKHWKKRKRRLILSMFTFRKYK